jgi:[ribosomal protein S5]-alanine N-acetyltransferase
MNIARVRFVRLPETLTADLVELNNNPRVLRHMPLARAEFTAEGCADWVAGKEAHWQQHGYGPLALYVDDEFAGWGGLQNEGGEADLALVLRPQLWGWGAVMFAAIVDDPAACPPQIDSITALLPTSRRGSGVMKRLGFSAEAAITVDGVVFERFRMPRSNGRFLVRTSG